MHSVFPKVVQHSGIKQDQRKVSQTHAISNEREVMQRYESSLTTAQNVKAAICIVLLKKTDASLSKQRLQFFSW